MIVFSGQIPAGLEEAATQIEAKIAQYYNGLYWGVDAFDDFLAK